VVHARDRALGGLVPSDGSDDLGAFQVGCTTGGAAHPTDGGRIVTRVVPGG
jgi:hypothetical protein